MSLNLLHGLAECDLGDTHFIETTTTGIHMAPHFPIPEGGVGRISWGSATNPLSVSQSSEAEYEVI